MADLRRFGRFAGRTDLPFSICLSRWFPFRKKHPMSNCKSKVGIRVGSRWFPVRLSGITLVLLSLGCGIADLAAQTVELRWKQPVIELQKPEVRIGEVVEVTSTDSALANRIRNLDLALLRPDEKSVALSVERVRYRIMLEGIAAERIRWTGETQALGVCRDDARIQQEICDWLETRLATEMGGGEGAIQVETAMSVLGPSLRDAWLATVPEERRLDLPRRLVPGQQGLWLQLKNGRGSDVRALFVVRLNLFLPQVVTTRAVAANTPLVAEDLQTVHQLVSDPNVRPVSAEELVGQKLSMAKGPNETLAPGALVPVTGAASRQQLDRAIAGSAPVIRRGQSIQIVGQVGPLMIRIPRARALAAGVPGEVILVENAQSRRQMLGRVLDDTTVELVR